MRARLRVAQVADQQHLLIRLAAAGNEAFDDLEAAFVESADDLRPHAHGLAVGQSGAQRLPLPRADDEAPAIRLHLTRPPEGGVLPGIGQVELAATAGLHPVEQDTGCAATAHRVFLHHGDRRVGQHQLAGDIDPFVVRVILPALAAERHYGELAVDRDAALDQADGHGREIAEGLACLPAFIEQRQPSVIACPFQEAGRRPEAGDPIGRIALDRHLHASHDKLRHDIVGCGSEAGAGLDAMEAADGDHVPVSDLIPVGAPNQISVFVSHVQAPFQLRT